MDKIITISIAAYNVEDTLERALDSLLCSRSIVDRIEIIVENDGSIDRTREIAEEYKAKYPESIIVNNKQNGGYGSTINESIGLATGKYFKQLDGDDWFETENLERFIDFLEKCDSDLVYSPHYIIKLEDETENRTQIDSFNNFTDTTLSLLKHAIPEDIGMHGLAIKTELLKKNKIKISEKCFYTDFEYVFYPVLFADTFSIFRLPVYNYLLGREGQSVSLTGEKKHYKDRIKVFMRTADYYEENKKSIVTIKKDFLGKKLANLAGDMYNSILLAVEETKQRDLFEEVDCKIKTQFPTVYEETNRRKSVAFLRRLKFNFLGRSIVKQRIKRRYM